jgi:stage II sporulation protein AA (anti-sigma F factor antagonist)
MELGFRKSGKYMIVSVRGEIDHHYAAEMKEIMDKQFEKSGCRNLVVDFSDVTFMDSSGIGMLIGRYKNVSAAGGRMIAAGVRPDIMRIYEMSGLKKIIETIGSVKDIEGGF